MARILVTERIAESGLERLREVGHEVDVQLDLDHDGLLDSIRGAHALIIRSATTVTADVLAAGVGLVVVGRAGIGLDNVDVEAASRQGVMVVNAPQSNTISAAEHTMALLLAQARNIPQAHGALKEGRWERSQWTGVELSEKTLGIVGLGRIGKLVAQRAAAFGMRLIGYDPFVSAERAAQMNVELLELEEVLGQSDFVTLHVAKTPETIGLINADSLKHAKPNLRIINVARGGIVDEADLAEAVANGVVAGAALDVFDKEPTTESPLFGLDQVVITPHLGASTAEAQDKAGTTIADQVELALAGEFVPFAVNLGASEASEAVRPYLPLAEQLGALFGSMCTELPKTIEVECQGEIGGYDNQITLLSALMGLFGQVSDAPVSYVNARATAKEHGVDVRLVSTPTQTDFINRILIRGGDHVVAGTLAGAKSEHRIVQLDDHKIDLAPSAHMVLVRNHDVPGVIGSVCTALGGAGVNINDMNVGQSPSGDRALMVIGTDGPAGDEVVAAIRSVENVISVQPLRLDQ